MKLHRASLSALLATSLMAAPLAASAASVAADRIGTPVEGEQLASGLGPAWVVAAVFVAVLGILVFSGDDEDPVSP